MTPAEHADHAPPAAKPCRCGTSPLGERPTGCVRARGAAGSGRQRPRSQCAVGHVRPPCSCAVRGRGEAIVALALVRGVSLRSAATSAGAADRNSARMCTVSSSRMRSPRGGELHMHLAPVLVAAGARDQALLHQPVHQLDRAVMLDLQALGKIGDARLFAVRLALDGQHAVDGVAARCRLWRAASSLKRTKRRI